MKVTVVAIVFLIPILSIGDQLSEVQAELSGQHTLISRNGPFLLDTSGLYAAVPDTNWQDRPDIAFDGVNYLVVWHDDRNGDFDVYGARLTQEGVVIDTGAFAIVNASDDQVNPAIAFDGNNYLVVWQDRRNGEWHIHGSRVTTSGVVLDTASIQISGELYNQRNPSISFGDSQYLVIWSNRDGSYPVSLSGCRVDTAGIVVDTSGIAVAPTGHPERSAVAFDGTNFFVIWAEAEYVGNFADIYGARVSASGQVLDTNAIFVGHGTWNWYCNSPSVAFDGINYLAVYSEKFTVYETHTQVCGHRVNQSGVVLDTNPILIYENTGSMPRAVFDGSNYLITLVREQPGWPPYYFEIKARRLNCAGQLIGATATVSAGDNWRRSPALVFGGSNYCAVWADCRDFVSSTIYGSRIDTSCVVLDPSGILVTTAPSLVGYGRQNRPAVLSDGNDYLAVWEDDYSDNIYGIRLTDTGIIPDTVPIFLSGHINPEYGPCISWNGMNYLAAWKRIYAGPTPTGTITTARIDQTGVVLDPGGVVIHYTTCGYPSISFDGVNHLIVFHRLHYENYMHVGNTIRGLLVNQNNSLISDFPIQYSINDWEFRSNPVVAFDGSNYLVTYYSGGWLQGIYGKFVTPAGVPIGAEIVLSNADCHDPSVVFGDSRYLVLWESDTDVFARFVETSGSVSDSILAICVAADSQAHTSVEFDGLNYWVVWQDRRNGEWDIYGARVDTLGNIIDEFPVCLQPGDQVAPAITRGPGNQLLITYSGWTDTINGQAANTMRIWGIFSTDVGVEEKSLPADVTWESLSIAPNPFHHYTDIRYRITDDGSGAGIRIFDITGRLVKEFNDSSPVAGGFLSVLWDGTDCRGLRLPQGVYFIYLIAGDRFETEKAIFLK